MIFVDTNVFVDVVKDDPDWADWSQRQLEAAAASDELAINAVVYAELSVGYQRVHDLDGMIAKAGIKLMPVPRAAYSSPERRFSDTAMPAAPKPGCSPISLSVRQR